MLASFMAATREGWYAFPVWWLRQFVIWSIAGMMAVRLAESLEKNSVAFLYCHRRELLAYGLTIYIDTHK